MNVTDHLPALQVVVLLLSAPLVVLLRPKGFAWLATLVTSAFTFTIAISLTLQVLGGDEARYSMGGWPAPFGIELHVDAFSALLLLIVTGASFITLLAARASINAQIEEHRQPLFYAAWLLAQAGLSGIVVSADAFNVFVFLEISSLASYVLIAGGPDRRAQTAVFKYLIMGTVGATFYLIGIGLIYMMTGTLNIADMGVRIVEVSGEAPILVAVGFVTVGLALKAAIFPLHLWLPNAYTFAPHAVTVFLGACATKVALYLLLRFDFFIFQQNIADHGLKFSVFLMPLALAGALFGSAAALYARDIKRLFAYSSIAQIGYITLGASLVTVAGLSAGIVHMFNHALAKGGVFVALMAIALHVRSTGFEDVAGVARKLPLTMAGFLVCALSLIGIPGTAGFISKWYLFSAAMDEGALGVLLIAVVVLSTLMAVAYVWRIVECAYFTEPRSADAHHSGGIEAPSMLLFSVWLLAALNIVFGLHSEVPVELANDSAALLLGHNQ